MRANCTSRTFESLPDVRICPQHVLCWDSLGSVKVTSRLTDVKDLRASCTDRVEIFRCCFVDAIPTLVVMLSKRAGHHSKSILKQTGRCRDIGVHGLAAVPGDVCCLFRTRSCCTAKRTEPAKRSTCTMFSHEAQTIFLVPVSLDAEG